MSHVPKGPLAAALLALFCPLSAHAADEDEGRRWLAGDHHVHSEWSVDWDRSTTPPTPIPGGDSRYTRTRNAQVAQANGLAWLVHTDHGGPGHSAVTRDQAWPALLEARQAVPGLVQFGGMEFDVPAGEHASVILPLGDDEREHAFVIERDHGRSEPLQGKRDTDAQMRDALRHMDGLAQRPLMFINHPSRTATALGQWGEVEPSELIAWHDTAAQVLVGMEGAPGHQATTTERGLYRNAAAPTLGGFDQMTAQVGGVWDAILASGRRFWITATSDSHVNVRDGGSDFDPGQYSKTYVWARPEAGDIFAGLREGRMFAVTGDLVDAVELRVSTLDAHGRLLASARMGETLAAGAGASLRVQLRVRQPTTPNHHDQRPALKHLELIVGEAGQGKTPRMRTRRFDAGQWQREGDWITAQWHLPMPTAGGFVRARGSSTDEVTPLPDTKGEDPWQDLWFYSNPVFIKRS